MSTIEDARMRSLRDKQIAEEQKRKAVAEPVKPAKVEKKKKKK